MVRSIAAAAAVFAVALTALQRTSQIASGLGEPVILVGMGILYIGFSKLLHPIAGLSGHGLGGIVLNHPTATAA